MKAIKKFSEGGVHFGLVETREPFVENDTDVKIRVDYIGICTSDVHVLHGTMQMPDGNIVGHEFSGTVVETGRLAAKHFLVGDRVVSELAKGACMKCKMCLSGHYELCPEKQPPGWKSQGVYSEYTVQPEFCIHKIPDGIPMDVAAMAEPVAICVYGCLERGKVNKDDFTVIYGMGSIGLFTLITLLDYGVKNIVCVTSVRKNRTRFHLAEELGATRVLADDDDIESEIQALNNGWKADCVIDCSGAPAAINQGIGLLNKGGKFIALGLTKDDRILFPFNQAVLQVLEIIFSATSSRNAWDITLGILERNRQKIERIITHQYPLEEWETAYSKLENREAVKAVLFNKLNHVV
jgi:L-iditol 2-dehydrogenase